MIKLDVMDICEECAHFEPESSTNIIYTDFGPVSITTTVRCQRKDICEGLVRRIREKGETR